MSHVSKAFKFIPKNEPGFREAPPPGRGREWTRAFSLTYLKDKHTHQISTRFPFTFLLPSQSPELLFPLFPFPCSQVTWVEF